MSVSPEMLDTVVVNNSARVDIGEIFLGNNVTRDTLEEDELGPVHDLLGGVEGEVLDGLQPALLGLGLSRDDVGNGSIAGKGTGQAATALNINVVAVTGGLVVNRG